MQKTRPGNSTKVRMAAGGTARRATAGVGAGPGGGGGVSEIVDSAAESRMDGAIFGMEIRGRDAAGGDECTAGGCVFDARKRMAGGNEWRTQIHLIHR